eukprot:4444662-Pleurochrysis_carterae.AAC.1
MQVRSTPDCWRLPPSPPPRRARAHTPRARSDMRTSGRRLGTKKHTHALVVPILRSEHQARPAEVVCRLHRRRRAHQHAHAGFVAVEARVHECRPPVLFERVGLRPRAQQHAGARCVAVFACIHQAGPAGVACNASVGPGACEHARALVVAVHAREHQRAPPCCCQPVHTRERLFDQHTRALCVPITARGHQAAAAVLRDGVNRRAVRHKQSDALHVTEQARTVQAAVALLINKVHTRFRRDQRTHHTFVPRLRGKVQRRATALTLLIQLLLQLASLACSFEDLDRCFVVVEACRCHEQRDRALALRGMQDWQIPEMVKISPRAGALEGLRPSGGS